MSDEFLYRLRRTPSPDFAARLKKKLDRQAAETASRKRVLRWCAALGILLCGTSFALISPTVRSYAVSVIHLFTGREPAASVAVESDGASAPETGTRAQSHSPPKLSQKQHAPSSAVTASQRLQDDASEESTGEDGGTSSSDAIGEPDASPASTPFIPARREARDVIRMVSSSRMYPFNLMVADLFGRNTSHKPPDVRHVPGPDALGLFCNGVGMQHTDIADATRRIARDDIDRCARNGVRDIVEIHIGYLAVTLSRSSTAVPLRLSAREVYLALADSVPDSTYPQRGSNRYMTWQQINPALPNEPIRVLGPPQDSELFATFAEFVLDAGCQTFPDLKELARTDPNRYRSLCYTLRPDGSYVDAGENEALILQQIITSAGALGIFSFNFYQAHTDQLSASPLDGFGPERNHVISGKYPASRSLYVYVKKAHLPLVRDLRRFVAAYTTENVIGSRGILASSGLIPLPDAERNVMRRRALSSETLQLDDARRDR
jgi:phosphate transport system substrate-binding protein